jgi:isoamyl acetate esterase
MPRSQEYGLYQPYDQFILFGDSITEMSSSQELGFAFHAALQDGEKSFRLSTAVEILS